jgi:superfamily II DNA/RNA helicase
VTQLDSAMAPLAKRLGLTSQTIFGGVGQNPQVQGLRAGVDVIVACPGRLEDLMGQGHVSLDAIEVTVLDEADHMADLGFLPGVRRIMDKTPRTGQRLLFSATLDGAINVLVKRFLTNPVTHEADSAQSPVSTMQHHVLHVATDGHLPVLLDLVAAPGRTVVFTRTKHRAKKLARQLNASGVPAVELHGNLSQGARTRNMDDFHSGRAKTLVATDIAARGIHVDDVALVVHADPPVEHKAYLHRSGRTARAGAAGTVVTMMLDDQVRDVRDLTRKAGIKPTTTRVATGHPLLSELAPGERSYAGGLVREPVPSVEGSGRGRGARKGSAAGRGGQNGRGAGASSDPGRGSADGRGSRGGRGRGAAGGAPKSGARRTGSGRPGGSGRRGGSAAVYSPSSGSGGAAAFSAGTRAGSR